MSFTIGVGIIGSGIFVREEHLPAVLDCKHLSLKAIYSRSLKSAKDVTSTLKDSSVTLYSDDSAQGITELLARTDIQAVIIALPIPKQPEFIRAALQAGKHVFAEKPVAKDVATAVELIAWYQDNIDTAKVTLGIAEQFRYLNAFLRGAERVREFGKVIGFRQRMSAGIQPGMKYLETEWRKKPEHQGGFLLDGGVHFIAGLRLMLGAEAKPARVAAFTKLLQPHLPPVDTVDATIKLSNGSQGTLSISFGTTFTGSEYSVACEKGSVSVSGSTVTTKAKGGEEEKEECPDTLGGVKQEVFAWAESLVEGKPQPRQSAKQALSDLELLEAMLLSGEQDGRPIDLQHQI